MKASPNFRLYGWRGNDWRLSLGVNCQRMSLSVSYRPPVSCRSNQSRQVPTGPETNLVDGNCEFLPDRG